MTGTWPTGWATGDMETAAEFKKGIGALSDTTLGGSAASVDITGIVGSYAHLLVIAYARGDTAADSTTMLVRFNNDSAANYDQQLLQGFGGSASASEAFGGTSALLGLIPAATAGANLFASSFTFIPHYAGSANNKAALSLSAFKSGASTGDMAETLTGGFWRSNAAISRITIRPVTGNLVAGTRVTIYGMGS